LSEARALELRHPTVGIGAEFGGEGVRGLERALDRGAVRDRLRGKEADPRQLDVAGAQPWCWGRWTAGPAGAEIMPLGLPRAGIPDRRCCSSA
jgi:hypothetical protein